MRGAAQHKRHPVIPTIKMVTCPACEKDRLGKYVGEDGTTAPVITETVMVRDEERHLDVCNFCITRYRKEDERFVMSNMRKLAKSAKDVTSKEEGSDHTDFSLN
jgi:hypothetical protein